MTFKLIIIMAQNINDAFGGLANALRVYDRRSTMLAKNQANSNTPGYLATDLDFKDVLAKGGDLTKHFSTNISNDRHINVSIEDKGDQIMYRTVVNPRLDGNTVDPEIEKVQYADNMMRYMATMSMFKSKLSDLMLAIHGTRR